MEKTEGGKSLNLVFDSVSYASSSFGDDVQCLVYYVYVRCGLCPVPLLCMDCGGDHGAERLQRAVREKR